MKKIIYFLFSIIITMTFTVKAKNTVYSINMDVYLNQDGSADITEIWDVLGSDGTEWFKQIENMGNSTLSNFTVSMDGTPLAYKDWNISESLEQKKGYYGINKISDGLELCFGKYDYSRHTFKLNYTMSNFIINVSDSQVLVWRLVNSMPNIDFKNFKITIQSFYAFPDTLDVWGTGYNGLAYVDNGKIFLSNESKPEMGEESYVVALVKFPINTFTNTNTTPLYEKFEDIKKAYDEGTFGYDEMSTFAKIMTAILGIGIPVGIGFLINYSIKKSGYGYIGNKKITKKTTHAFRDIPCNKDIYYANTLIKLNNFGYKETNIFGAIILKWVKEEKIAFIKETKNGLFKSKEEYTLDLRKKNVFLNNLEEKLFNYMYEASNDGLLEAKEFEKWSRINYDRFLKIFNDIEDNKLNELKRNGLIYKRQNKSECKYYNVMNDNIYEDSKELLGLKIFLEDFASMDTKETMEVHLWDEYLMFAYLFGIADKVQKQLQKLYPELINQNDIDYPTMMMINNFSHQTVSSAVRAAQHYSSGGGGFSTGGGGGGSFGGGFSGSR